MPRKTHFSTPSHGEFEISKVKNEFQPFNCEVEYDANDESVAVTYLNMFQAIFVFEVCQNSCAPISGKVLRLLLEFERKEEYRISPQPPDSRTVERSRGRVTLLYNRSSRTVAMAWEWRTNRRG